MRQADNAIHYKAYPVTAASNPLVLYQTLHARSVHVQNAYKEACLNNYT